MKVIDFDKSSKQNFSDSIKSLEKFLEDYNKSSGDALVCFYLDRATKNMNHIVHWVSGMGLSVIGSLDIMKQVVMEKFKGIYKE